MTRMWIFGTQWNALVFADWAFLSRIIIYFLPHLFWQNEFSWLHFFFFLFCGETFRLLPVLKWSLFPWNWKKWRLKGEEKGEISNGAHNPNCGPKTPYFVEKLANTLLILSRYSYFKSSMRLGGNNAHNLSSVGSSSNNKRVLSFTRAGKIYQTRLSQPGSAS